MKPEAINHAMAELDGWKPTTDGGICWDEHGNPIIEYTVYTADLNAVARVVGKLKIDTWWKYRDRLHKLQDAGAIDATALQRCEAILRACGKWVEE